MIYFCAECMHTLVMGIFSVCREWRELEDKDLGMGQRGRGWWVSSEIQG